MAWNNIFNSKLQETCVLFIVRIQVTRFEGCFKKENKIFFIDANTMMHISSCTSSAFHFKTLEHYHFYSYQQIHRNTSSNGGLDCANLRLLEKKIYEKISNSWIDSDETCGTMHLTWSTMEIMQIVGWNYWRMKKKALTSPTCWNALRHNYKLFYVIYRSH